ncbi:histidinol phosphate phosphatase [Clostridium aestuarii]|uniref:Histidinol-phosphatase n=1 Tax=Clostridium aestuarii TaxID=338193 RepID=A0ABT4CVN4_9CLOT|nr:histidinol phosphate phosphatase [Clostridium aestuarii]MCY6482877.1 histidinol phosphate phosphatase [Clostridium aestuarii]
MFDSHMHTSFSSDSEMNIESAIKKGQDLDIGLIVTDHYDYNFPIEGEFIFDVNTYFDTYSKYRNDKLLLGIELGMKEDALEENKKLCEKYKFDYVIGSIHVINNIDIYEELFYKGKSKKEVYLQYFNAMLNCVKSHDFIDSLGHIDYISRYARFPDTEIYYNEYKEVISEILKTIINNDIVLELNAKRLNNNKNIKEMINIYKRYYELGGKYVTLGSDAHTSENIAINFNNARYILEECKLKDIYFKNRNKNFNI